MPIQQFHVRRLHGLIDARVDFNNDLTILVGMNGSGKTSILTMITDMLRFDVPRLLQTEFEHASLLFSTSEGSPVRLTLDRDEQGVIAKLGSDGEEPLQTRLTPMRLVVDAPAVAAGSGTALSGTTLSINPYWSTWMDKTFDSSMLFDWGGVKEKIKDAMAALPLTFLRVDRTLAASDPSGDVSIEDNGVKAGSASKGRRIDDPIDVVLRVTTKLFTEYKDRLEKIRTASYERITSLSFSDRLFLDAAEKVSVPDLEQNLRNLQSRVKTSSLLPKDPNFTDTVDRYFEDTTSLLHLYRSINHGPNVAEQTNLIEALLVTRQSRVRELLDIFNTEKHKTDEAYARLDIYLQTLNRFMDDSGKKLAFDSKTNTLGFYSPRTSKLSNSNGTEPTLRSIRTLSSGERQIVIAFTYLCFLTKSPGIFVIDEPELSLHLAWQQQLVDGLNAVKPRGCQIVLATHTPEIVGRAPDKVAILEPQFADEDESGESER